MQPKFPESFFSSAPCASIPPRHWSLLLPRRLPTERATGTAQKLQATAQNKAAGEPTTATVGQEPAQEQPLQQVQGSLRLEMCDWGTDKDQLGWIRDHQPCCSQRRCCGWDPRAVNTSALGVPATSSSTAESQQNHRDQLSVSLH